jgi:hypothetical protein
MAKGRVEKIDIRSASLTEYLFFRYFFLPLRGRGGDGGKYKMFPLKLGLPSQFLVKYQEIFHR